MTFEILSHGTPLGETDLESHDTGMNVRAGRFRPRHAYFDVRAIFKAYAAALDMRGSVQQIAMGSYYLERDRLELTVRDREGLEVPSGAIHILDLEDSVDDIQVEIYPPDHSPKQP